MVNILSLKKANFLSEVIHLDLIDATEEITSTAYPVKILDISWKSTYPIDIYYQDTNSSSSQICLPAGQHHFQYPLAANGMEIPGTARFFISSPHGKCIEGDYVRITYVG